VAKELAATICLEGEAAGSSETLAKIEAYYNFRTVNSNFFIFSPCELGRVLKAFCFYIKHLWPLTLHAQ
jgi:hypothetical protein